LLADLAYRADDAALSDVADRHLAPILLDTVAGGVFFADYAATEDVCFRKLEKLSGQDLGKSAGKWKAWWSRAGEGFRARRALRSASADELRRCTILVRRAPPGGRAEIVAFAGEDAAPAATAGALVLGAAERTVAADLLRRGDVFSGASDAGDENDPRGASEITVADDARRARRRRVPGADPALDAAVDGLLALRSDLLWQRLAPPEPQARAAWLAEKRPIFEAAPPGERRRLGLEIALAGYADFGRDARAVAVQMAAEAPVEWRVQRAAELAKWLRAETSTNDEAATLIRLLGDASSPEARDEVLAFAERAPGPRADEALAGYLSRRDASAATAAFRSRSGAVRAVGARALARFRDRPETAELLFEGLKDFEPRVRDASVASLAEIRDERTAAMLEAVLAGDDKGLRLRAVEALGAIAGDQATPRLMEIHRDGGPHERAAVLRSLEQARGVRARVALAAIARESAEVGPAVDATAALGRIGGDDAAARLAGLIRNAPLKEVRLQAVGALAALLGARAAPVLREHLADPDLVVRRVVVLAAGRVGMKEALEPLLTYLEAPAGDAAAEDAFRRLTFFASTRRSPRERFLELRAWADEHGGRSRREWLRAAFEAARVDPAPLEGYLAGGALDPAGFATLLRAVRAGSPPVREEADRLLRRAAGSTAPPLLPDADEETIENRARLFEAWAARQSDALRRGLPPDPELSPSTPEFVPTPGDDDAAPASRPGG
ncbi:MAG TPA: HEAT repeat domain-containing protein, partial [Planctomycetota bacterium]|nr:HEAT repeat domain-containing protein [Planctomycetota bacterium]